MRQWLEVGSPRFALTHLVRVTGAGLVADLTGLTNLEGGKNGLAFWAYQDRDHHHEQMIRCQHVTAFVSLAHAEAASAAFFDSLSRVLKNTLTSGLEQCIALQVEMLVIGRDTGVAKKHGSSNWCVEIYCRRMLINGKRFWML